MWSWVGGVRMLEVFAKVKLVSLPSWLWAHTYLFKHTTQGTCSFRPPQNRGSLAILSVVPLNTKSQCNLQPCPINKARRCLSSFQEELKCPIALKIWHLKILHLYCHLTKTLLNFEFLDLLGYQPHGEELRVFWEDYDLCCALEFPALFC